MYFFYLIGWNLLQQLSSIPETSNSEDMQEFLALNSDVCTYFGRKPCGKSRIDKVGESTFARALCLW